MVDVRGLDTSLRSNPGNALKLSLKKDNLGKSIEWIWGKQKRPEVLCIEPHGIPRPHNPQSPSLLDLLLS